MESAKVLIRFAWWPVVGGLIACCLPATVVFLQVIGADFAWPLAPYLVGLYVTSLPGSAWLVYTCWRMAWCFIIAARTQHPIQYVADGIFNHNVHWFLRSRLWQCDAGEFQAAVAYVRYVSR
jgi:hypothetical protein